MASLVAVAVPIVVGSLLQEPAGPDPCAPTAEQAARSADDSFASAQKDLQAGRWSQAEANLRAAIESQSGHALARYGLGQVLLERGRPAEAAAAFAASRVAFRCLVSADPERRAQLERERNGQIQMLRSVLQELEKRRDVEPQIQWKEVNSHEPPPSRQNTQRLILDLQTRIADLERARAGRDPAPPAVTLALGTALVQAGDFVAAEQELRAAIAADPRSGDAHNNLAVALLATGRLDEAEREAQLARKLGVPVSPRLFEEIRRRRR